MEEDSIIEEVTSNADKDMLESILKLKLDGVMYHTTLFELLMKNEVCGMAFLHKYKAKEEYDEYLDIVQEFINTYKEIPMTDNVKQPTISIAAQTKEDIIIESLKLYENWENKVCEKLKHYSKELKETPNYLTYLINGVKEEKKYIRRMWDDIEDGKYKEVEQYLIKKWGA